MRIIYEENEAMKNPNEEIKFKFEVGKTYFGQYSNGSPAEFKVIKRSDKFVTVARPSDEKPRRFKIDLSWNGESETFFVNSSGVLVSAEDTFNSQKEFNNWAKKNGAKL